MRRAGPQPHGPGATRGRPGHTPHAALRIAWTEGGPDQLLSVVIPARNRLPALQATLGALRSQRAAPPWEAIVVDDGSTDGTLTWLAREAPAVRVVRTGGRGNRAAARNAGARSAVGEVLLFLDADVVLLPEALATHARLQARGGRRVVSGSPWCWYEIPGPVPRGSLSRQLAAMEARARPRPIPRGVRTETAGPAPWLHFVTRVVSLAADEFWGAGAFSERFAGYGFEDWELGYRLQRRGVRLTQASDGSGYHLPHPTADRGAGDLRRNFGVFLDAHPDLDVALMALAPPWANRSRYVGLLASARRLRVRWPEAGRGLEAVALAAARGFVADGGRARPGRPLPLTRWPGFTPGRALDGGVREALWWLQRLGDAGVGGAGARGASPLPAGWNAAGRRVSGG